MDLRARRNMRQNRGWKHRANDRVDRGAERLEVVVLPGVYYMVQHGMQLWLFALYPALTPENVRRTGLIRFPYADARRGDSS